MGVKVKTPSPFVGAGQVGTVTPNLSGLGSAIAGVADDLLTTRFEDRKQVYFYYSFCRKAKDD